MTTRFAVIDSDTGLTFATADTSAGVRAAIDAAQHETLRRHHAVDYVKHNAAINARNLALITAANRRLKLRRNHR